MHHDTCTPTITDAYGRTVIYCEHGRHPSPYDARLLKADDVTRLPTETVITRLRANLTTIATLWPLMLPAGAKAKPHSHIRAAPDGAAAPLSEWTVDLRAATAAVLAGWVCLVAEQRGIVATGLDASDGSGMATWLGKHAVWLGEHEAGRDALGEIQPKARAIHAACNPQPPEQPVLHGPCLNECGASLWAPADTAVLTCVTCGAQQNAHEVRAAAREHARSQLVTAAEAVHMGAALGTTLRRGTITEWARRGRLAAHSADHAGHPLYPYRDIEILARVSIHRATLALARSTTPTVTTS